MVISSIFIELRSSEHRATLNAKFFFQNAHYAASALWVYLKLLSLKMFVSTLNPGRHHRLFLVVQMAPDYDHLTLMEKVEVFEHAVNNTAGDDLAKLLWLKSPSSEVRLLFYSVWG